MGKRFQIKNPEWNRTCFSRLDFKSDEDGIIMHQKWHIEKLNPISSQKTFTTFWSLLAKLVRVQQTRPYITFEFLILRPVTDKQYLKETSQFVEQVLEN